MTTHATGPFDVKLTPLPPADSAGGSGVPRFSIDKQYHGGLEATGKGEMLTAGTAVQGSAAYVAVERVTGTLNGRRGSFILYHTGVMDRGTPHLAIKVVPDSGTDELVGLTGTVAIIVAEGKHSYDFEYSLPSAP